MNIDMTNEKTAKNIVYFSIPLLFGSILQNLYNIVDTVIVGRFIGKEELSIVGNLFAPMLLVNSTIMGSASGITILISYYVGEKNLSEIEKMYSAILKLAVGMSCILTLFGLLMPRYILECMKIPNAMLDGGCNYFRIITLGFPFVIIYNYLAALFKGYGNSRSPLYFLILSCCVNIFLDILFVTVWHQGIRGVAFATVLSQIISAICMVFYLIHKEKSLLKKIQWNSHDLKRISNILKYGITSTVQNSFSAVSMMYIQSVINGFGINVISAFSVAYKIETILTVPAVCLGSSLGVYVGQNKGRRYTKKIEEGLYVAVFLSLILFLFVNLIVWLWGKNILQLVVGNEKEVIYYGELYLKIISSFYFFLTMLYLLTNFLRSAGEVIYPVFNTILELTSRVLLVYILARYAGIIGIFMGRPISFLISMTSLLVRYKCGNWKRKIFAEGQNE